jgi:hypothetical protein
VWFLCLCLLFMAMQSLCKAPLICLAVQLCSPLWKKVEMQHANQRPADNPLTASSKFVHGVVGSSTAFVSLVCVACWQAHMINAHVHGDVFHTCC